MTEDQPVTVGLLYGGEKTGHTILQAVESLGYTAKPVSPHHLGVDIGRGDVSVPEEMDVLVNWRLQHQTGMTLTTHELVRAVEDAIPVVNPSGGVVAAASKLSSSAQLHAAGIPVPRTMYSMSLRRATDYREEFEGFVQKPLFGGTGTDVTKRGRDDAVTMLPGPQVGLVQEPIETPGDRHWDVRAYVVDGEVVTAMTRTAGEDRWRTNVSQEGDTAPYDLPSDAEALAVKATNVLGLDAAGVDVIQSTDGTWYVLEVNAPASVKGITATTGVNPAAYIAATAIRKAGETVPDAQVDALAEQLRYVEGSDTWDERDRAERPSFRMRVENTGQCLLVGETKRVVSATIDAEQEFSLIRASVLEGVSVDILDVQTIEIGGAMQARPRVSVTLVKDEVAKTVTGLIVEDDNPALMSDIVLTA